MKAVVGSSILPNSYDAGIETAKTALRGIRNPKIGFLFTSAKYNQKEFLKGIKSINSDLKIIGCTSDEMIMTPDGIISSKDGFAGMMVLEENELTVGVAITDCGNDPRIAGRNVAIEAMANADKKYPPTAFALFTTPEYEEDYLKGIQDILGEIPVFGGSAATELENEFRVICENKETTNGCAIALFYSTKEIKNIFTTGYEETDNIGIITKVADERQIVEIDNEPALKKYAEWANIDASKLLEEDIKRKSSLNPLGIKNLNSDFIAIRHIINAESDYSFKVGAKVSDKMALIYMKTDIDGLIESSIKSIKSLESDVKPAALILIQSQGRKISIEDQMDEDFVAIKNATGDTPFIALFTNSEFGQMDHSGTIVANLSLSFTSFSE